jgi:hypothetical protein
MMIRFGFILTLLTAHAMAAPIHSVKLKGLSSIEGKHTALFEIPSSNARQQMQCVILSEGERHSDFEFVDFNPDTGQLQIRNGAEEKSFEWSKGESILELKDASINHLINVYAMWTTRVQIVASSVGGGRISYRSGPQDTRQTVLAQLKELARENGILFQDVGDKFLIVDQANNPGRLAKAAAMFEPRSADEEINREGQPDVIPLVRFDRTYLQQVLELYSEVTGRTILRSQFLPVTTFVTLKSDVPLMRMEAANAMEAAMAVNDIQVRSVLGQFTFIYTREAPLIDGLATKLSKAIEEEQRAAGGAQPKPFTIISFQNMPLDQFCAVYAKYADTKIMEGQEIPRTFMTLKSQGNLTKAATIAACDAVLALNGFELVLEGDKGLKLVKFGERGK